MKCTSQVEGVCSDIWRGKIKEDLVIHSKVESDFLCGEVIDEYYVSEM